MSVSPETQWVFDNRQMNRIQAAILRGDSMSDYIDEARVPSEQVAEVIAFWEPLAIELAKPLPKGHYWDLISD